jgi:hypothetical protein
MDDARLGMCEPLLSGDDRRLGIGAGLLSGNSGLPEVDDSRLSVDEPRLGGA